MGHLTKRSVQWTRAGQTLTHKTTSKNLIAERRCSANALNWDHAAEVVHKHAHDAEVLAEEARCLVWKPVRSMIRHLGIQSSPQGYAVMFTYDETDVHVRQHVRQLAKTVAPKVTGLVHAKALQNPTAFEKAAPAAMYTTPVVHYFDFGQFLINALVEDFSERLRKVNSFSERPTSPHGHTGSIRAPMSDSRPMAAGPEFTLAHYDSECARPPSSALPPGDILRVPQVGANLLRFARWQVTKTSLDFCLADADGACCTCWVHPHPAPQCPVTVGIPSPKLSASFPSSTRR
jgi:hypothetical protein